MSRSVRALVTAFAAVLASAAPAAAASPDVVVSQLYGGGGNSGATFTNDFVELFNRGASAVDVTGWSVQYASAAGTTWQRTTLSGTIAPGAHYLVQEGAGAGGTTPLPTPDAGGGIAMSATAGKVALVTNDTNLACGTLCSSAPGVRDFVGFGTTASDSETAAAPAPSNTTADVRNGNGCVDSDNNALDFVTGAPGPRNTASAPTPCGGDAAPSVTATDPAANDVDVAFDANVDVTFSEPVTAGAGAFTLACTDSGEHAVAVSGGPTTFTLDPAADFTRGETCTLTVHADGVSDQDTDDPPDHPASDFTARFTTVGQELRIHDIQGLRHISSHDGEVVSHVPGIVTGRDDNGFWIQDPQPDGDPRTSEGVFVFTGGAPPAAAAVNAAVLVSGRVDEFRSSPTDLTTTEIGNPHVTATGETGTIAPTVIGRGGGVPPNRVIDNDSTGDVDANPGPLDPGQDGIDFYESLEGMLVQVNDAVAVGPTNRFGETPVVGDNGSLASVRSPRGGVVASPGDFNPERFFFDQTPVMNVGDKIPGATLAEVGYGFGNFMLHPLSPVAVTSGGIQRETTGAPKADQLAIASFNVENLAPSDPASKYERLASILVDNLRSPDLVAVEEIQDNNGTANDGTVAANVTWQKLIDAVVTAGGPRYEHRQIDPVDGEDGGAPGGNIRQGFLFRTDRGLAFVDRPGGTSTTATSEDATQRGAQLTFSPGRLQPDDPAFTDSRKPLAGEFRWKGKPLFVVANHFNSKGGDDPLFGHFQPPRFPSETQRHAQATIVNSFVKSVERADPLANVVVLGDLNDFDFSETLDILEGKELFNLMDLLPRSERYSYVFEGNSEVLDQVLVSWPMLLGLPQYDSVHVNAEFADQASDHDPQVARLRVVH